MKRARKHFCRKCFFGHESKFLFCFIKTNTCWLWKRPTSGCGYAYIKVNGKATPAHRYSWEFHNKAKIPKGMCVCHSCDVRHCVNPDHLWIGSNLENQRDKVAKGRSYRGGPKVHFTRLTDEDIRQIRIKGKNGEKQKDIADQFGTDQGTVSRIIRMILRPHVS